MNPVAEFCGAAEVAKAAGLDYLTFARRWVRGHARQALAIMEEIGSFEASDPDLRALQQAWHESLGQPRGGSRGQ